jgi:hypothetical protein
LNEGDVGVVEVLFGGGVEVPGSAPAPLTANDPAPVHGSPVSGLSPLVEFRGAPIPGETGASGC